MLNLLNFNTAERSLQRLLFFVAAILFAFATTAPFLVTGQANAATLTSRRVTISTSQPSATGVSYAFDFTLPGTSPANDTPVQSMAFSFCTTPLGACTLPTGMIVDRGTTTTDGGTSFTQATAFTEYAGADAGGCTTADGGAAATQYCVTRTQATAEAAADSKSIQINAVQNPSIPSGNNTSVYIRISIYSDTAFATAVHDGTVAASIVNQLTVTGRVQERLVFCVFALDDAAGSSATVGAAATNFPTDCAASEATASSNVDIGVIDNLGVARSPVDNSPPTSLGNDRFGAAMVNTNASSGVAITYYATPATSGTNQLTAFRVAGASCNASAAFIGDQCFVSANDTTGTTIAAGTETFGMQIVCVTDAATTTAGTTSNLGTAGNGSGTAGTFNTAYANGDTTLANLQDTVATDNCENTEAGNLYAWRATGTTQPLISSTTVVDDELVKLRFGASADPTTPTGTYTVASTFIATPTF
jgi:hypothetical protein